VLQALICHTLDKKCFTRPKIVDGLLFWEPEAFDQVCNLAASLVFFLQLNYARCFDTFAIIDEDDL
jgi:hypothetical protein